MIVNPSYVAQFNSNAEKKIYHAFRMSPPDDYYVYHSLNIPKHEKKQFAEADFLVLSKHGILLLEVKGGRLKVSDGIWFTTNENNKTTQLKESPFRQVETARFALEKMLKEAFPNLPTDKTVFGFGAMFPDIKFGKIGIEITKEMTFDAIDWDRKRLIQWVEQLYKYWSLRTKNNYKLTDLEISQYRKALRSEFDREKSLLAKVSDSWERMLTLTENQYRTVDIIQANPRVIIQGGAGTGKTLLACKAAKSLASSGKKIIMTCRNPTLASFLSNYLSDFSVDVFDFNYLVDKVNKSGKLDYDILIVDEGQDLIDIDSVDILNKVFKADTLSSGQWYFFMDPNHQSSIYEEFNEAVYELLSEISFRVPLFQNCRNTFQIASHTLLHTGGNIGKDPISASGLPVIWETLIYDTQEELIKLINDQLKNWVDDQDVKLGDITILSPMTFENSTAYRLDKRWRRKVVVIDRNYGERWLDTQLSFSTFVDFKGLENKYVMLIDLESVTESSRPENLLYVAMTRANTLLWIATNQSQKKWYENKRIENANLLKQYIDGVIYG